MVMIEFETTKGNIVEVEKDEVPYREFHYLIDGQVVASGRKRDIQKELGITSAVINRRLSNTRTKRIKKNHKLILIER